MKVAVVSAITAILVFFALAALMFGVYYFICCEPVGTKADSPAGEGIADRIERAGRTLTGSTTDAAKITGVSFSAWSHAGPLYPGPKDPSGYVSSSSIEFRRELTAIREKKKDYDRDLPDETTRASATLAPEQFEKLAAVCAANDIANEPNATDNRTEASSTLVIEYNGEKKSIVTSNRGQDSERVANVIAALKQLENSLKWDPAKGQ